MGIVSFKYSIPTKKIGSEDLGFVEIDAFLSEQYGFSNSVTEIPVGDGSVINDHVTEGQDEISVSAFIGKTKLSKWVNDISEAEEYTIPESEDDLPAEDLKVRIKQAYFELLRLVREKQPVTVVMGLDTFDNMIITSFNIGREAATGADLPFGMSFKKIDIVKSETTAINASGAGAGGDQAAGMANAGTVGTNRPNQQSNRMKEEWRLSVQSGLSTPEEYQQKWGSPYPQ
jgi:hypothetical protein